MLKTNLLLDRLRRTKGLLADILTVHCTPFHITFNVHSDSIQAAIGSSHKLFENNVVVIMDNDSDYLTFLEYLYQISHSFKY